MSLPDGFSAVLGTSRGSQALPQEPRSSAPVIQPARYVERVTRLFERMKRYSEREAGRPWFPDVLYGMATEEGLSVDLGHVTVDRRELYPIIAVFLENAVDQAPVAHIAHGYDGHWHLYLVTRAA